MYSLLKQNLAIKCKEDNHIITPADLWLFNMTKGASLPVLAGWDKGTGCTYYGSRDSLFMNASELLTVPIIIYQSTFNHYNRSLKKETSSCTT